MSQRLHTLGLASLLLLPFYSEAKPEITKHGLAVNSGPYRVEFRADAAWTLGSISYQKEPLLGFTGANQTAVNRRDAPPNTADPFIGSSHGGEEITKVSLEIDGTPYSITPHLEAPAGKEYAIVKESKIGPFLLNTRTAVSEEGIQQTISFEPIESINAARYLYVFMHCWNAALSEWMAIDAEGTTLSESFPGHKSNTLKKQVSMIALYSPETMTGAVLSYPTAYNGEAGHYNTFINWPGRHNKHYLRLTPEQAAGQTYSCWIRGFKAPSATWQEDATQLHNEHQPQ